MINAVPVDMETWPRKEAFAHYRLFSDPFYMVTFRIDVTDLYNWAKANEVSFYLALVGLCAKSLNAVENFRYTTRGGEVCLLERRDIAFCILPDGADQFHMTCMEYKDGFDLKTFCREAREKSQRQTHFMEESLGDDHMVFSCVPWIDSTAVTEPHSFRTEDEVGSNIPSLAWGAYTIEDGRKKLLISIDTSHRFVDGLHITRFVKGLEQMIHEL